MKKFAPKFVSSVVMFSMVLSIGSSVLPFIANASQASKITICHATGSGHYNQITISENGLNGHSHHANDIIPMPKGGCPGAPTPIDCTDPANANNDECVTPPDTCDVTDVTHTVVSGTDTQQDSHNSVAVSPIHDHWTASIPDATWIWGETLTDANAVAGQTETFTKIFNISGAPTSGSLDIATDNTYTVTVNSTVIEPTGPDSTFNTGPQTYDISGALTTGDNTLTISVTNLAVADSTALSNPAGLLFKLTTHENDCQTPDPTPTTTTVNAQKLICNSEEDLPDWGAGGPDVTSTTASQYVIDHPSCHLADWNFAWSLDGVGNPGDGTTGTGGTGWNGFSTSTTVPSGQRIWFREQPSNDYIPFTGQTTVEGDNGSAEFYCGSDVLNYDNWEFADTVAGQPISCVGFNVPKTPTAPSCDANQELVSNGSFENGVDTGPNFNTVSAGDSTSITGWTVDSGTVDYMSPTYWQPGDASRDVDLSGNDAGSISQTFATVVGKTYNVGFKLSGNPENGPILTDVKVSATGAASQDFTYNTGTKGNTNADMKWESDTYSFVATATSTTLTFASQTSGAYGPVIDKVSIMCNPNPVAPVCDASVNLLSNGSFESPVVSNPGLWDIFPSGTATLAWAVNWLNSTGAPATANMEVQKNNIYPGWAASDGTQWTELDSDYFGPNNAGQGHPAVAISQNVATVSGQNYSVALDFSARPSTAASDNSVEVLANNVVIGTVGPTAPGAVPTWTNHSFNFTATGASTPITFRDAGTSADSLGTFIDNTSVKCVPAQGGPSTVKVTIEKYIKSGGELPTTLPATAVGTSNATFPMTATWNATNIGSGTAGFSLGPVGFNNPNPYQATTSDMTSGASYSVVENLGSECNADNQGQYVLEGYKIGDSESAALASSVVSTAALSNITSDKFIIVVNKKCGQVLGDSTIKVHIYKYLPGDSVVPVQVPDDSTAPAFPMTATWQTANLNGGASTSGTYVLGNNHGGAAFKYAADTAPMNVPANYTTSEVTDGSVVVPADSNSCPEGKYKLVGYKSSTVSLADAQTQSTSTTAPNFTALGTDAYVIVVNTPCAPVPPPTCDAGSYTDTSDNSGAIRFETSQGYSIGSISGQDGWSNAVNPAYDQGVVANTYGYPSFDAQSLRMSDAVTSGSFGDWVFPKPLLNSAGETGATGTVNGTRQDHFEAQFDIASTRPCEQQTGLHISVSPDRGDGSRMSYLRFEDGPTGLDVFFDDVTGTNQGTENFNETKIATGLTRNIPHKVKFAMDFVNGTNGDGSANDVVKIYIDGTLVHTGTSWETYYRYDAEASSEQSPRLVNTLIFQSRTGSGPVTNPADAGKGYLFDNLTLSSSQNDNGGDQTPHSDLSVTKTEENDAPTVGSNITYAITVSNAGPNTASNVVVNDLLPAGLTWVSDDSSGAYNHSTGVWTVGALANAASATLNVTVTVNSGTAGEHITNTATASSSTADTNPDNNSGTKTIVPVAASTPNASLTSGGGGGGGSGKTACADGKDNDGDGLIDSADPGCHSDGNASNAGSYVPSDNSELSGVLGAETSCGIYLDKFLQKGHKNDPDAVKKVQQFLNDYLKAGLSVDGVFGSKTDTWVKSFQQGHKDKILTPWGLLGPTGIVYLTTTTEINNIMCPTLNLPIPSLTPLDTNPDVPPKI